VRANEGEEAVDRRSIPQQLAVPSRHVRHLRRTGTPLAAKAGGSLRDLMTRMGHDTPAAAIIYLMSPEGGILQDTNVRPRLFGRRGRPGR
jgi:hypothetical protein